MKLGYTVQTTPMVMKEAVDKWASRYNATREEWQFRNVGMEDREYDLGMMTQDERYEYETQEKVFPYTGVEFTVTDPSDECRKEFFVVRGFMAGNKTEDDLRAIGY